MTTCSNCGKGISAADKFCPFCGKAVSRMGGVSTGQVTAESQTIQGGMNTAPSNDQRTPDGGPSWFQDHSSSTFNMCVDCGAEVLKPALLCGNCRRKPKTAGAHQAVAGARTPINTASTNVSPVSADVVPILFGDRFRDRNEFEPAAPMAARFVTWLAISAIVISLNIPIIGGLLTAVAMAIMAFYFWKVLIRILRRFDAWKPYETCCHHGVSAPIANPLGEGPR